MYSPSRSPLPPPSPLQYCKVISLQLIKINGEKISKYIKQQEGFPGGSAVKNLPANAGDTAPIPGLGGPYVPQSNKARASQPVRLCLEPGSHSY